MPEAVVVALVTAGGVTAAAIVAAAATIATAILRRMTRAESTNVSLWTYTRLLIDHIYRGGIGPPPPPPDHIRHLYESETT